MYGEAKQICLFVPRKEMFGCAPHPAGAPL